MGEGCLIVRTPTPLLLAFPKTRCLPLDNVGLMPYRRRIVVVGEFLPAAP